jgi:hypothetical protein
MFGLSAEAMLTSPTTAVSAAAIRGMRVLSGEGIPEDTVQQPKSYLR